MSRLIVALRKESVDRNRYHRDDVSDQRVALRKESVDRNILSAFDVLTVSVALRKESVDRNYYADKDCDWVRGRSPQGERG